MKTGLWHNFVTALLVVLACLSIVATTFLVWFQQTALNTDQFVAIVATSTEDPQVIEFDQPPAGDQVVTALDVENRLLELLPDRLDRLAAPFAEALRGWDSRCRDQRALCAGVPGDLARVADGDPWRIGGIPARRYDQRADRRWNADDRRHRRRQRCHRATPGERRHTGDHRMCRTSLPNRTGRLRSIG